MNDQRMVDVGLLHEFNRYLQCQKDSQWQRDLINRTCKAIDGPGVEPVAEKVEDAPGMVNWLKPVPFGAPLYLAAPSAPVQSVPDEVCAWKPMDDEFMPGTYEGSCGAAWTFNDGGVAENDMKYCPQCGRKVVTEHAPQRPLSEDGGESTAQSVACPTDKEKRE